MFSENEMLVLSLNEKQEGIQSLRRWECCSGLMCDYTATVQKDPKDTPFTIHYYG